MQREALAAVVGERPSQVPSARDPSAPLWAGSGALRHLRSIHKRPSGWGFLPEGLVSE